MSAFAAAMDAIFSDPNMAADAIWYPFGSTPVPVRVIRKVPDEVTTFGAAQILSETSLVDVRVAEMPNPKPGDGVAIGADSFVIQGEPKRDREHLIWTLELVPG